MSISSKKLINSPDTCVDECLYGLSVAHPQLQLHPHHRVLINTVANPKRKVAIISGGGAGHEPFAAGYVGPGMLTAAVSGSVFASPPSSHVMHAIRSAARISQSVFLVIPNYTGDILNFGLSVELTRNEGIDIDSIVIGEDIALKSFGIETRAGQRGMCGMVVVFKILGHLSQSGQNLQEVKRMASVLSSSMASIGVAVTACSLPGAGPLFQLGENEIELGVGVHGEAGVQRMSMVTAEQLIDTFLTRLLPSLELLEGQDVAAFVNNLGAMTNIEQWVVLGELKKQLTSRGIRVLRIYAGSLFTSLNMSGVQVCLLRLDPDVRDVILEALDAPTSAPAWPGCPVSVPPIDPIENTDDLVETTRAAPRGCGLPVEGEQALKMAVQQAARAMILSEARLNDLDSGCGDGDCGTTLRHLAQDLERRDLVFRYPATLAFQLADVAQHTMGGTSGALYSLFFTSAGQELESLPDLKGPNAWVRAWNAGLNGMKKYSLARRGDRTMFDALEPACDAFHRSVQDGCEGVEAFRVAVDAAKQGCADTKNMKALAGRASYVEGSQLKEVDAGAFAVAVWLSAVLEALQRFNQI